MPNLTISAMGGLIFLMQLIVAQFLERAFIARFPNTTLAKGLAAISL